MDTNIDSPKAIESSQYHSRHLWLMSRMRYTVIAALILACIFALLTFKYLTRPPYVEVINNFDTKMTVQENGEILVTENIVYDFGYNKKIGITRYIPLISENNPRLNVSVLGVEDDLGQSYQYQASVQDDVLRIATGDSEARVSGIKTYKITYKAKNAVMKDTNFNRVYWNVTGDQWPAPINSATTLITLPGRVVGGLNMNCSTGPRGSTERSCLYDRVDTAEATTISYSTTKPLMIIEGFTILLDFPLELIN